VPYVPIVDISAYPEAVGAELNPSVGRAGTRMTLVFSTGRQAQGGSDRRPGPGPGATGLPERDRGRPALRGHRRP
jgi:hypothetical protein